MTSAHTDSPDGGGQTLHRGLTNRHIQLIAIGGAIGTGLFMGSGKTISLAGPSVMLAYALIGFMLFFVMRAMGELLLSNSKYKNFADFCGDLLGPWAKFFVGWTYWFCWIVTAASDVIAVTDYIMFWTGDLDRTILWIPGAALILVLLVLNLPSVKGFGETEFWFALIKIVAILALIVVGLALVISGFSHSGNTAAFSNLWAHGGFFPTGFMGFVAGFQIAVFAFVGIELAGAAAAEAENPEKTLPKAINAIPIRIIIFYVGALAVLLMVTPWNEYSADRSPFVAMFALAGLGIAASVVNFVVLTSASSSANSGIYSTSRMVYGLALEGGAPQQFGRLSRRHVPRNALFLSCVFLLSGIVLLYANGVMGAFTIVTSISSISFMFVWTLILFSYLVYRKRYPQRHAASIYKMPGGAFMPYVVMAFFVFVIWSLTTQSDTLFAMSVTPIWFVLLGAVYCLVRRSTTHRELRRQHAETVQHAVAEREDWRRAAAP